MKLHTRISLILAALMLATSCAGDYNPATSKTAQRKASGPLADKLEKMVGQRPDSIGPSAAPGLLEAKWGSNFAYITADGEYAVFGDMVNINTLDEVTEKSRRGTRLAELKELGVENMIEFAPPSPKYTVTVFTDIDCGYCRMLHRHMPEYNEQGIAVHYVFYPRTGPGTDSFRKAEAVWCSADRQAAMTAAKTNGDIQGSTDCVNPIQREWELGQRIGLRGTPMIVLPNGDTIAGYVPPAELMSRLAAMDAPHQIGRR